jgi:2-polyprenyl-6-methoxyphenol hydroxylase-like FAD-dependent oxidoreductase
LADRVEEAGDDVEGAFAVYEALRAPRTARVQRNARVFGEIIHADAVGRMLRDALLSRIAPDDLRYVDWLYGQNIAAKVPVPIG